MATNAYKQARLNAAKKDPSFSTVEHTYQQLFMSRERLLMIEQTDPNKRKADPNPEEVQLMAKVYGAPELLDHYCTHQCPMKKGNTPLLHDNLGEISANLMSSLHFLYKVDDKIHNILSDSKVVPEEVEEFKKILKALKDIAYSANSLELWAKKNGLTE